VARVRLTAQLHRLTGALREAEIDAARVRDLVDALDARARGLRRYLLDDSGALREHVLIFVDGEGVRDRERLSDPLRPGARVDILQAPAGG
jgi:molybdopterin converting factor small subunit